MRRIFVPLVLVIFAVSVSGCLSLREAYVPDYILKNGWRENTEKEERGTGLFGFEKWSIKVYEKSDVAWLTITTLKTLFLYEKKKLLDMVVKGIERECKDKEIQLEEVGGGSRELMNGHKSKFVLFNGTDGENRYKIIGEVWACAQSGTSIMCIGMAKVSEIEGLVAWKELVRDPNGSIEGLKGEGLIYCVKCH